MTIAKTFSLGEIFSGIALLLTMVTILIACLTYHYKKRTKTTDELFELMNTFYTDDQLRIVLKKIDKEPEDADADCSNWYEDNKFTDPEDEARIDRLFYIFSYICYMRKKKRIPEELFDYIGYYIKVAADDHETKEYLEYIANMLREKGLKPTDSPLYYFQEYVCERGKQKNVANK